MGMRRVHQSQNNFLPIWKKNTKIPKIFLVTSRKDLQLGKYGTKKEKPINMEEQFLQILPIE